MTHRPPKAQYRPRHQRIPGAPQLDYEKPHECQSAWLVGGTHQCRCGKQWEKQSRPLPPPR